MNPALYMVGGPKLGIVQAAAAAEVEASRVAHPAYTHRERTRSA
jgi:hypothetical protein